MISNDKTKHTWQRLSRPVKDFYNDKDPYAIKRLDEFRASIGITIAQVERIFIGMFGARLGSDLTNQDLETFSRVFPRVYSSLSDKYTTLKNSSLINGIQRITFLIESIRNINMHMKGNYKYFQYFVIPEEFRCFYNDNKNPRIAYLTDRGELTIGGMLFTIFSFANESMFKTIQKEKNFLINAYLCALLDGEGILKKADENELVKIFDTHFEELVRPYKEGLTLKEAIAGKYNSTCYRDDDSFQITLEDNDQYSRGISGIVIENKDGQDVIKINKGSNLGIYYREDYRLEIADKENFIEASLKVPPFMLIAYLYQKGITKFTNNCLLENPDKEAEDDKYPYLKLNWAKFYVDKNIRILTLGHKDADVRPIHTAIMPKINALFIFLERELYEKYSIPLQQKYTTLKEAFTYLKFNRETADKIIVIRNFFAHQNILGDTIGFGSGFVTMNLAFILESFKRFLVELSAFDKGVCKNIETAFSEKIVRTLLLFKYNDISKFWEKVMNNAFVENHEFTVDKYNLRMNSSIITFEIENKLSNFAMRPFKFIDTDVSYEYECINRYHIVNNTGKPIILGQLKFANKELTVISYKKLDMMSRIGWKLVGTSESRYVKTEEIAIE